MKKMLVFSNGEKIGDGIIKIPFLYEIKKRLPGIKLYWMTNTGTTVYNNRLKNIASQYIETIFEQANLQPFFWKKISTKYNLENIKFDYILDTQKAVMRTIALKRLKYDFFISATASGFFSNKKISKISKSREYYLDELINLLDIIKPGEMQNDFKFLIPEKLIMQLDNLFNKKYSYIGYAPGAGEHNKIWDFSKFIEVIKYFEDKKYKTVLFLGPDEIELTAKFKKLLPEAIYPEEIIQNFSGPEIIMACTQYLSCSLSNDSGVSHMLTSNHSPLIKLFGPKDSKKFTPKISNIHTISSINYGSSDINNIPTLDVIKKIEKEILT